MDIKDLKCFQVVYQEESINKAAQKLYITPQGLGKNIQNLELELGTTLFERTSSGVKATESAHFLIGHAQSLISQFESLENEIKQRTNCKKVLRIGYAYGVFHLLPLQLIRCFIKEHTSIQVEWCEYSNQAVKQLLESSEIDYGFFVGNWNHVKMQTHKLATCGISLLVYEEHPLYLEKSVSLSHIAQEDILMMNETFRMHHDILDACKARGFHLNILAKTMDATVLYKLCSQKMGLAIIPNFLVEEFNMVGLKALPFEEAMSWDVYSAYKQSHKDFEKIALFHQYLHQHL